MTGKNDRTLCAIICLLAISLSGCLRATSTPEPVTITFAYENIQRWYYEPLGQQFSERYPHITVELRPWAWPRGPDYSADVNVAFSWNALTLQEQGEISMLSLEPLVEQDGSFDLSDFYPGAVGFFTSGGETWGIPTGMDVGVMYYDQELFDQYGVPYPEIGWTWHDFLNAALALRDFKADVFGYGMNRPSLGDYTPQEAMDKAQREAVSRMAAR